MSAGAEASGASPPPPRYTEPDVAWPLLVYDGASVVGFVMAHFEESTGLGFSPTGEVDDGEIVMSLGLADIQA